MWRSVWRSVRGSTRGSMGGFTLIEVTGALVVFSLGVLMVITMSGTLSLRMERSALRSELALIGQERLDSLELVDFDNLAVGTTQSSSPIRGQAYTWSVTVSDSSAVLLHVDVSGTPQSGSGPRFNGATFVARVW